MKTKVSIVKCRTYNRVEVQKSIERAFDLLGGISSFIKSGEKVLVKPNMLSASVPESGVTTHVEIVRAVVRLVKTCGATPVIGDTPGGSISAKEAYIASGMSSIAKEEGVKLAEVKNVKVVNEIPIAGYFFECDKIISLPKMKTHNLMTITGAVKNMYGAVAGLNKTHAHRRFPRPEEFVNVLIDVFEAVKPHLVLMDGVIAMDGDGPNAGRLREVGLLIASNDSVSVDSVFSHLIGVRPFDILTTKEAYTRGIGEAEIENIEVLGEKLERCFVKDFKLPHSRFVMRLPGPLLRMIASLIRYRPYINTKLCKKCHVCVKSCPVSAIIVNEEKIDIDYRRCIRCMCCHEVCPYVAVGLRRNFLAKLVGL